MKIKVVPTAFALIATIGGILLPYGWHLRDMELMTMKGELIPFEVDPQKPIEIQVGGIHVNTTLDELSEGFNLSRYVAVVGFDYPFRIKSKDGKFLTSVDIRNADGEMVAKIVDNQWVVNENKVIARDRNYNAYAFEVIDSDLVPVIQVVFEPQNKLYLGGLFYFPNGRLFAYDDVTTINPSPESISENIKPIFKYPSEEHLCQMVNQSLPTTNSLWVIFVGIILLILGSLVFSNSVLGQKRKKTKSERQRTKGLKKSARPERSSGPFREYTPPSISQLINV